MLRWYVKELLEARGMSMENLSHRSDVSYETVKRICHDPFHRGKVSTRDKLALALKVEWSEILREDRAGDDQRS
jgi:transcriptional regulator with XRE-family HTH domain